MITVEEMRALEDKAEKQGISKLQLMENAGKAIAQVIEEKFDHKGKHILVVCWHGNNGGDGFACANELAEKAEVEVLFIGDEASLKAEAKEFFHKVEGNERIQFISLEFVNFDDYDIIIDAMLGIGSNGELRPPIATVIDFINEAKGTKIAIDIPTGMHPDSGEIIGRAIEADLIITFHDIKKGLEKLKDKVVVVDIGIPTS